MSEFMKIQDCQLTEITTVPIWVPFRVPGPPGPLGDLFVNLGPLIGLLFCLKASVQWEKASWSPGATLQPAATLQAAHSPIEHL